MTLKRFLNHIRFINVKLMWKVYFCSIMQAISYNQWLFLPPSNVPTTGYCYCCQLPTSIMVLNIIVFCSITQAVCYYHWLLLPTATVPTTGYCYCCQLSSSIMVLNIIIFWRRYISKLSIWLFHELKETLFHNYHYIFHSYFYACYLIYPNRFFKYLCSPDYGQSTNETS